MQHDLEPSFDDDVRCQRATYVLEHGTWTARCNTCHWEVRHPIRRQAASLFRYHIRAARSAPAVAERVDLRESVLAAEGPVGHDQLLFGEA